MHVAFFQGCFVTVASFSTNAEHRYATMFVRSQGIKKTVSFPVCGVIKQRCRRLHIYIAENASRTKFVQMYVTRMYSYVNRMLLVRTGKLLVCARFLLVCIRMYSCVSVWLLVRMYSCGVTIL